MTAARGPVDPRLLRHARSSRGGIAALSVLGLGQAGATLLVAVALTRIVAGPRGHAVVLLAAAFAARAVLSGAEQVVAQRTAARVTDELRRSVLTAALRRGPAWVARYGSGRLTAVLTQGLDTLRPWFSGYLPALVLGVSLPPLVVVAIALVDPASAVIALVTLPLIPVLGALIGWATQARARQRWDADARLAGHFLDVVRGLTTLRVYGRAERQIDVVAQMTDRHRGATMRVLRVAFLSSTALDLVGTLAVGLIAVEAGLRVASGSLGLGTALLVILLAPEAYRPLREVAARFHASADATAVVADVDEVLAGAPAAARARDDVGGVPASAAAQSREDSAGVLVPAAARPRDDVGSVLAPAAARPREDSAGAPAAAQARDDLAGVPAPDPRRAPGVTARGLQVRYPGSDVDALRLGGLAVRGGEFAALRGPSGAGKTTALRALAGIQPLDAGTVRVSGPVLYLSQRPALPHARTVADVFGPGADVSAALRVVGLDDEVTAETPLGERGTGVSAGQRQRLALAALVERARGGPVVMLLDEPTAHLDAKTEALVIAELRAAARRGCAVLAVAHRPELLAAADTVIDVTPPAAVPAREEPAAGLAAPVARSADSAPAITAAGSVPVTPVAEAVPVTIQHGQRRPGQHSQGQHSQGQHGQGQHGQGQHGQGQHGQGQHGQGQHGQSQQSQHAQGQHAQGQHAQGQQSQGEQSQHGQGQRTQGQQAREGEHGRHSQDRHDAGAGREGPAESRIPGTPGGEALSQRRWLVRPGGAVALGAFSWLAGVVLTAAAAWLLVRAASLPPVLTLSTAVVLVRASAVARPLLRYLERLVSHEVAFARLGARRARVYADLIPRVPGPRLHRRGELLSRVVGDVDAQVDGLLRGRLPALAAAAALGLASVVAVLVVPAAGIPLAAGLAVSAVLAPALAARQAGRREAATGRARDQLHDAIVETVDGVEDLAAVAARPVLCAGPAPGGEARAGASGARRVSRGAPGPVSGGEAVAVPEGRSGVLARLEARAARSAGMAAGIAHLGWGLAVVGTAVAMSRVGAPAPEWAAALLLGIVALGEPVAGLAEAAVAMQRAGAADRRLAALAAEPVGARRIREPDAAPVDSAGWGDVEVSGLMAGWGDVEVSGLVAGWDPDRAPALKGVDLRLPAGARVAVLGPSGGGKSTLAAVLARLLDPRAGRVTIGGVDARTLPDRVVRRRIALVGDDADHVFASSVRENLRLARPDADDRMLTAVLERVGLPGWDLDTVLGAGGTTISGGQRRRFATARALLADPSLLILDEPTEGLDAAGAEALMADLLDAAVGRTVLVLTHRTEGLDRADRTLVLRDGRIKTLTTADA